jgi:hypothetical protein
VAGPQDQYGPPGGYQERDPRPDPQRDSSVAPPNMQPPVIRQSAIQPPNMAPRPPSAQTGVTVGLDDQRQRQQDRIQGALSGAGERILAANAAPAVDPRSGKMAAAVGPPSPMPANAFAQAQPALGVAQAQPPGKGRPKAVREQKGVFPEPSYRQGTASRTSATSSRGSAGIAFPLLLAVLAFIIGFGVATVVFGIWVIEQPEVAGKFDAMGPLIRRIGGFMQLAMFILLPLALAVAVFAWFLPSTPSSSPSQNAAHGRRREQKGAAQRATGRVNPLSQPIAAGPEQQLAAGESEPDVEPLPPQKLDPAMFEEHEPTDPTDPVPPTDTVELEKDNWAIIGASRRGIGHAHDAKYREDSLAGAIVAGGWHMAAVCDGGGAYSLARVGAKVAAEAALAGMKGQLRYLMSLPQEQQRQFQYPDGARSMLLAGLNRAYRAVDDEAKARGVDRKELRTTLLLLLHRPQLRGGNQDLVAGAQIGDGLIAAYDATGRLYPLGTPDTGPSNNEVLFLQDVDPSEWEKRIVVQAIPGPCRCLAMTDGVSDDFAPYDPNLARLEKPLFDRLLRAKKPQAAADAMLDLIGYQRQGSFDDRTLVVIYKQR